jgi:plastocyanin
VPARGDDPPPFALPTADKVSGALDAAGHPFWFNGVLPTLAVNPRAAAPTKGTTYSGSAFRNSGLPSLPNAKPYGLRFTKTGTFTYYCAVHPGMKGRVRVVGTSTSVPTQAQNRAAAARELNRIAAQARVTAARPARSPTIVDLGRAPHDRRFTINAFFPSAITARVGQVIEFSMAGQNPNEIHTVTFGSPQTREQVPFVTQTGAINPIAAYRSEPPEAPLIVTGTNHGNGFLNAGLHDADRATPTIRNASRVAFSKPGTYHVVCLVHEGMDANVTVTP